MIKKVGKYFAIFAIALSVNASAMTDNVSVSVIDTDSGNISVNLKANSDVTADIFAAAYKENGDMEKVSIKHRVSLNENMEQTVTFDDIDADNKTKLFVWDSSQKPLCEALNINPAPTQSPENTDSPVNTQKPESTPFPTESPATSPTVFPIQTFAPETTVTPSDKKEPGIIYLENTSVDTNGVEGVTTESGILTITAAGEYSIKGVLEDGQIVVSDGLGKKDEVILNLIGTDITSKLSAPFDAENAKVTLNLGENTTNIFTDSSDVNSVKSCVYSKRDLTVRGNGLLKVNGNFKNGIVCDSDFEVKDGASIDVTAKNNAVKAENNIKITKKANTVTIMSQEGDGLKTESIDEDTYESPAVESDKGIISVNGGTVIINAPLGDGIQADNYCEIKGGTIDITAGGEGIKANETGLLSITDDIVDTDENGINVLVNGKVIISGGKVTITSGEDGIKAAESVIISDSADVTINGNGEESDAVQVGSSIDETDGNVTTETVKVAGLFEMTGGKITIEKTGDDGIVSNGIINISGGEISGNAANDFMKAYDDVIVTDGNISIISGCDGIQSGNGLVKTVSGNTETESNYTKGNVNISGGSINIKTSSGHTAAAVSGSCKGIKAITGLNISGGDITIDSADDSIHSNYNVTITGGNITAASADDGIHADYMLTLGTEGGTEDSHTIDVTYSYEGLEASLIKFLSGTQYVYAKDDGINAAGDYSEDGILHEALLNGGPGGWNQGPVFGGDDSSAYGMIYIKGGKIYAEAYGDGLDSNGSIDMSGGTVLINGPSNGGNGVFDIGDTNSASFKVTGGTLIGAGSSDMAVYPSVTGQGCISSKSQSGGMGGRPGQASGSSSSGTAGSHIKVVTDNGNIVFTPKTNYNFLYITTPDMTAGKTYTTSTVSDYTGGKQILGKSVNGIFYGLVENVD